jgi:hypothetical protein
MTAHLLKNNFSRGELSPKAYSRADLELYGGGAALVRNFICVEAGGLRRRPGSIYAGQVKSHTKDTSWIEFVFSTDNQAYMIEVGDFYFRFWTQGGQVVDGSDVPVEVVTPYSEFEIRDIQFVLVGNVLYLAHPDHEPQTLTRQSHTSWVLADMEFVDGPYLPINNTDNEVTSSADLTAGTNTTLTFDTTEGINDGDGFQSTDVGRHIRVRSTGSPTNWVFGVISAVTSTDEVDVDWIRGSGTLGGGTGGGSPDSGGGGGAAAGTTAWRLGAFSGTTGYPACVELFEQRLVWARTDYQPRTVFFSRTGLPGDYAPSNGDSTVTADHGMALDIIAGRFDKILWLREAPRLQIGTSSGVRTIGASDTSSGLSPTNISQRLEVNTGADFVIPAVVGTSTVYLEKFGKALRNMYYDYQLNGLTAPSISTIHEHLFVEPVIKVAFADTPDKVLWALRQDGTVIGVTINAEEKVIAFHRHDLGTDSFVKDIGVIPGEDRDEVWLLVERTINGQIVCYVEYLDRTFNELDDDIEDAFFVDCGLTYDGVPTNTISGADHLAGEAVDVLADGAVLTGLSVGLDGTLTFPNSREYEKVHIGKNIVAEAKTLRPPFQGQDGWILGRKQNVTDVHIEVIMSGPISVGTEESHQPIQYRRGTETFGTPPNLRDGVFKQPVQDRWSNGGQVYMIMDKPLPAFVRSLVINLDFEGESK